VHWRASLATAALIAMFGSNSTVSTPDAHPALADGLRAPHGERAFVEDRTEGRALEQLRFRA
jgi:hypothetical protein